MLTTYLRTYSAPWPVISTKNYTRNSDGWWCWNPKKRRNNRVTN